MSTGIGASWYGNLSFGIDYFAAASAKRALDNQKASEYKPPLARKEAAPPFAGVQVPLTHSRPPHHCENSKVSGRRYDARDW